jgi:predicted glycosyltransferase
MGARAKILIHVQHLLGTGHLRRAAQLARACAEAEFEVRVVSGGFPVPGLDLGRATLIQLDPARARDGDFSTLIDGDGAPVSDVWKTARRKRLLDIFASERPEVLIVEMFPFGRRQLRFELLPLLEAAQLARPRPLVLCSVRDILQTGRKPTSVAEAADTARRFFDAVLVHGDPALIDFGATFPLADQIADLIRYTGYLAPPAPLPAAPDDVGYDEVVVSAGGGAVGTHLLEAAAAARSLSTLKDRRWRLLAGHEMTAPARRALEDRAGSGIVVEAARPDFLRLLAGCAVSVSQAGYNTVMDVLSAGARAVFVPFAGAGETEQTTRAERLERCGRAVMLAEASLTPQRLAAAIDTTATRPVGGLAFDLDGAAKSARIIADMLAARRG